MPFHVTCNDCGADHIVSEESVGRVGKCGNCGAYMRIAAAATDPTRPVSELPKAVDKQPALTTPVKATLIVCSAISIAAISLPIVHEWDTIVHYWNEIKRPANRSAEPPQSPRAKPKTADVRPLLAPGRREQGETPFERKVNSVDYDTRVRIWAEQFDRSESWVRRQVSPDDSAAKANAKLVRARSLEDESGGHGTGAIDELEAVARRQLDKVNRKSWQEGYPLDLRQEAARRTLIEQGYSEKEARATVRDMTTYGLLPDPPRR